MGDLLGTFMAHKENLSAKMAKKTTLINVRFTDICGCINGLVVLHVGSHLLAGQLMADNSSVSGKPYPCRI